MSKSVTFGKPLCRDIKRMEHRQFQTLFYGQHINDFGLFGCFFFAFAPS